MKKKLVILGLTAAVLTTSCGKICRCYRYDGNVDEFYIEDLNEQDISCEMLEYQNNGTLYSLCERVLSEM